VIPDNIHGVPRLDVSTVLNVSWRPETLGSRVVALVEQRVDALRTSALFRASFDSAIFRS
jgi:hypothetical protein